MTEARTVVRVCSVCKDERVVTAYQFRNMRRPHLCVACSLKLRSAKTGNISIPPRGHTYYRYTSKGAE